MPRLVPIIEQEALQEIDDFLTAPERADLFHQIGKTFQAFFAMPVVGVAFRHLAVELGLETLGECRVTFNFAGFAVQIEKIESGDW